jgi:hypothetical protein
MKNISNTSSRVEMIKYTNKTELKASGCVSIDIKLMLYVANCINRD